MWGTILRREIACAQAALIFFRWGCSGRGRFFSFVPNVFPSISPCVPHVLAIYSPTSSHSIKFYPICFGKRCPPLTYINQPNNITLLLLWALLHVCSLVSKVFVGPCPYKDEDYHIGSNFWKFYFIRISLTLGEPVSLVEVFRLFRLERIVLVFRVWTQQVDVQHFIYWQARHVCDALFRVTPTS